MASIMIVDDHELVLAGLQRLLSELPDLQILAAVNSAQEAVHIAKTKQPDLILMDLRMPGIGGLAAISKILQRHPKIKVIVLTTCTQELFPRRALKAGVKGYLTKGANLEKMHEAIQTVMAGKIYVDPEVANTLALKNLSDTNQSPIDELAKRELAIFLKIAQGFDVATIANELSISTKTVSTYRYRIYKKLNISNDVQLTLLALQHRLLEGMDY